MTQADLNSLLDAHRAWLDDPETGACLKLRGESLVGLDLSDGWLFRGTLEDVDITGTSLDQDVMVNLRGREVCWDNASLRGLNAYRGELGQCSMQGS